MDKVLEEGAVGEFGHQSIEFVEGKIVAKVVLSPKALLDMLAVKIGGPIPAEIAAFLEAALGLK